MQELEAQADYYLVGSNPSYDCLPFWGRMIVKYIYLPLERFIYFKWRWRNAPASQCICTDRDLADTLAMESPERGFVQQLPVNRNLPHGLVRYGYQNHPLSPAAEKYLRREKFKVAGVNTDLLNETKELAGKLRRRV